jgi:uncharacterized protein YndB with AHSA1/START domain
MVTAMGLAIRKSVTVKVPIEQAFDVFTRRIHTWWPLATHSIRAGRDEQAPEELHLELREGGRLYEKTGEEEGSWGTVLAYDPPWRIVLEWHVNPKNPPTEIEVTFTPDGEGTRVDLVHSGWERFASDGGETRASYAGENGWTAVLALFAEATAYSR